MKYVRSEKPVTTTKEIGGKKYEIKVTVETPQAESMDEAITFDGGQDAALEFHNSAVDTNAKNGARAILRNLPDTAFSIVDGEARLNTDAEKKVQDAAREYSPVAGARDLGKAKKAEKYDEVKALVESGKEFTREELLALLAGAK